MMSSVSRRKILKYSGYLSLVPVLLKRRAFATNNGRANHAWFASGQSGDLMPYQPDGTSTEQEIVGESLLFTNPARQNELSLSLTDRVHGIIQCPWDSELFAVISKPGKTSFVVRVMEDKVSLLASFTAKDGHVFSGHAAFSRTYRSLIVGENFLKAGKTVNTVRDPYTGNVIATFPGHGSDAHEVIPLDEGARILQAVKTEQGSSLVVIDVKSGELVKKYDSPIEGQIFRHFLLRDNVAYVGCKLDASIGSKSKMSSALVAVDLVSGECNVFDFLNGGATSAQQSWQYLSLAMGSGPQPLLMATSDTMDRVVCFDSSNGKVLQSFHIKKPTGVIALKNTNRYLVNTSEGKFFEIDGDSKTFQPIAVGTTVLTGPHLYQFLV